MRPRLVEFILYFRYYDIGNIYSTNKYPLGPHIPDKRKYIQTGSLALKEDISIS